MPTPDLLDPNKEHTLILVKPDGFARGLPERSCVALKRRAMS